MRAFYFTKSRLHKEDTRAGRADFFAPGISIDGLNHRNNHFSLVSIAR
jgi:hypothetical protein